MLRAFSVISALAMGAASSGIPCTREVQFAIETTGLWTAARHPTDYPEVNDHFSPPVVVASNVYELFTPGVDATTGLKNVAETGNPTVINEEIAAQITNGTAFSTSVGAGSGPTCCGDAVRDNPAISVRGGASKVSGVFMLAPSPDWFTGIRGVDLCDSSTGEWLSEVTVSSATWDAGTDSGTTYNSDNNATSPAVAVSEITAANFPSSVLVSNGVALPTASWKFTLVPPATSGIPCGREVQFAIETTGLWTAARHPTDYPEVNDHFSPPVVVASNVYELFTPGVDATTGLKNVAETGNPTVINEEIAAQITNGTAFSTSVGAGSGPTCCGDAVRDNPAISVRGGASKVSGVFMLAPSPDWFTGIRGVDLCDSSTGEWLSEVTVSSATWDAGTDSGTTYNSDNNATSPAVAVSEITAANFPSSVLVSNGVALPTASWKFTLDDREDHSATMPLVIAAGVVVFLVTIPPLIYACFKGTKPDVMMMQPKSVEVEVTDEVSMNSNTVHVMTAEAV